MPDLLTRAELARLTRHLEGRLSASLLRAVGKAKAGVRLSAVERALLEQNVEAAIDALGIDTVRNALADMQEAAAQVRQLGWQQIVDALPARIAQQATLQLTFSAYTLDRPEVMLAVRTADLRRIQGIDTETRMALRQELARVIRDGVHPTEAARQIRDLIGLNQKQAAAVASFRQQLVAEGRDRSQVERMTLRFANRQLQLRASTIAQTETMSALNTGRRLQSERLVREQVIQAEDWEQEWRSAEDDRTCPICEPLNGQRVPIGGTFVTAVGPLQQPPAHPRCRCVTVPTLAGFRAGEEPAPARRRILERLGVAG